MFHESLSATQMTSGISALQEKASSSRSLSRQFMDILVEKTIGKPDFMHWVLETWAPSMEGSAGFLQLLKDRMSLEWWMQQEPAIREQILKQLIRIDDGRGIIADWLALIVREENHIAVLQTAAEWESRKYPFTDQLLEAWGDRSFDGLSGDDLEAVNRQAVRETALKVVVNAMLPSGLSSGTSPGYVDGSALNEERRAGMILKHLSERLYTGKMIEELGILSNWKPSPVLHGKKILSEIFCEWERHMQKVAGVIMGTGINENLPGYDDLERYLYLRAAWKGLINSSANCTEAADRLLSGIKNWLDRKRNNELTVLPPPGIIEDMLQWNPPDESRREEVGVLCSRYLLSRDGYTNPDVWRAMGKYFSGCRNPGPGMEEINHNCLHALGFMMQIKEHEGQWKEKILEAVVCPPWLTKEQQIKWESLWTDMMASGSFNMLKPVIRHLLGLAAAGLSDPKVVKKAISDSILEKLPHIYGDLVTKIINELTDSIGQWKGKTSPALTALRLEILNMEVWDKLMEHSNPRIRQCAWKFFVSLGDGLENETGKLLVKWLRKEKDTDVLRVMAGWKPSPGGSLPAGLEEGWTKCLQKLLVDNYRSCVFVSGKRIMRSEIKTFEMARNTKDIIDLGKDLIRTLAVTRTVASLEGQPGAKGQSAQFNVDGLRVLWRKIRETVTETMGRFLPEYNLDRSGSDTRQMQGEMAKLFWLTELGTPPERFLFFFSTMAEKKFFACRTVRLAWEDLLEAVEGMEIKRFPVNVRHNLGAMAVLMLNWCPLEHSKRYDTEKVFMKLCGDGAWTPDRTPAGWEEFCREFCRICTEYDGGTFSPERQREEICRMIRLGQTITDERFHHLFMPALFQFLGSAKPELAAVIENALWREVAGRYEMARRMGPDGKAPDKAGEWYWLRQFMWYQEQVSRACERHDRNVEFVNSLWTELNGCLFSRETEGETGNRRVRGQRLNDQEIVFTHPRRSGNCENGRCPVVPPDRLTGTGPAWRPVYQPSFSFGK